MALKHLLLLFLIFAAFSAKPNQAQVLKVVTEHNPPFNYQLRNDKIVGSATDKILKVLEEANIEFTLNIYPWARSYKMALTQPNTLIFSIFRNKQRESLFQWICPLLPGDELYLFALKKNNLIQITNLEDLKQYKIGVVREGIDSVYLKSQGFKEGKELYPASNDGINLKLLLQEKVDLIISGTPSMKKRLKNINQNLSIVKKVSFPELNKDIELCMAFSLNTPSHIVDKVRAALYKVNTN